MPSETHIEKKRTLTRGQRREHIMRGKGEISTRKKHESIQTGPLTVVHKDA